MQTAHSSYMYPASSPRYKYGARSKTSLAATSRQAAFGVVTTPKYSTSSVSRDWGRTHARAPSSTSTSTTLAASSRKQRRSSITAGGRLVTHGKTSSTSLRVHTRSDHDTHNTTRRAKTTRHADPRPPHQGLSALSLMANRKEDYTSYRRPMRSAATRTSTRSLMREREDDELLLGMSRPIRTASNGDFRVRVVSAAAAEPARPSPSRQAARTREVRHSSPADYALQHYADAVPTSRFSYDVDDEQHSRKSPSASPQSSSSSTSRHRTRHTTAPHRRPLVGLGNLGNTCFMSSALQCLLSIPNLLEYFGGTAYVRDINSRSVTRGRLARAFGDFVADIQESRDYAVAHPSVLKRTVEIVAPQFAGYGQHDSQEFVVFFLAGLHDDVNLVRKQPAYESIEDREGESDDAKSDRWWRNYTGRNRSVLHDLFCGQLRSVVQCQACDHVSTVFDPFWDLSLPIPGGASAPSRPHRRYTTGYSSYGRGYESPPRRGESVPLLECFRAFTEEETLTGNNKVYCSRCKAHQTSTKALTVWRYPDVLVLHLKRFRKNSFRRGKIQTHVRIESHLDLSKFAVSQDAKKRAPRYELFAVSNHSGGTGGGHYTATCNVSGPHEAARWVQFNDTSVREVRYESIGGSSAYLLFYRRIGT